MVLFFFDKILKDKYKKINKNITLDKLREKGIKHLLKIFPLYFSDINDNYIEILLADKNNKILFNCIDHDFKLSNIVSILIFHKTKTKEFNNYYILLLGTHSEFRRYGYGKIIIDDFITWIKLNNNNNNNKSKIILKSITSSLEFYLNYGFIQTNNKFFKLFYKYEPYISDNEKYILDLII